MKEGILMEKYRKIRSGKEDEILLEGIHAFKHAFRFGADFHEILYTDERQFETLKNNVLKKEEKDFLLSFGKKISNELFDKLIPYTTRSKVLSVVGKPEYQKNKVDKNLPIVFLENPANPENIGMALRVTAAFGAGAFAVSGKTSVFSASVLRAGAGLCFALPVFNLREENLQDFFPERKVVIADPDGESLREVKIPKNCIFVFGTEREGVSKKMKDKADLKIKLDMKEGVSSLNLATSVSAVLFSADFD